ncbi:hypothetical protein E5288_WYG020926 [Bos mutus]|uniref:Uncharacterized protein n=1 Tax=Bos mutus TaxID=72004 RepID=A0A6B0R6R4_9CETA|nr:hypothetical protein [Bos mutus]
MLLRSGCVSIRAQAGPGLGTPGGHIWKAESENRPPSWVQFVICEPPSQVRRKEAVAVPRKVPHDREVAP